MFNSAGQTSAVAVVGAVAGSLDAELVALPIGPSMHARSCSTASDAAACGRYFARIAEERMAEDDAVIMVTHQPRWLAEWFWEETGSHNLRQLVRGSLRGRARVWLSGPMQ